MASEMRNLEELFMFPFFINGTAEEREGNFTLLQEYINNATAAAAYKRDALYIILPVTIIYCLIFAVGIVGNCIICIVIAKNKSMHTATNYYLFNLAVSDFLLLLVGLPVDTYGIWFPAAYPMNKIVCIFQGLMSETATNATVLTITSFTLERYIAICHPFRSHTMSKLSRAVKFVIAIWIIAFGLATPQALQFGILEIGSGRFCTIKDALHEHAFVVSSFLFFVGPMTVICALYIRIGIKLRKSKYIQGVKRQNSDYGKCVSGQSRVIRMLIAVVAAFFICWAPFHAQRLMAVYGTTHDLIRNETFTKIYTVLNYASGVLYFMSTCINPLLYNIMSHKFRDASKKTLSDSCCGNSKKESYTALSRYGAGSFRLTSTTINRHNAIQDTSNFHMANQSNATTRNNNSIRKSDSHCISLCSQATNITTISQNDGPALQQNEKHSSSAPSNNMSTIAEKLRRGTKKVLLFKSSTPSTQLSLDGNENKIRLKQKHSIDSGNTISNSSLQEFDEEEFSSAELAKFMGEINKEIRETIPKPTY